MQQHACDAISSQVDRHALVDDVQRRLAGPVSVASTSPVVINRPHFAANVSHESFPAKTANQAVDQQLLHHDQGSNRVGFVGLHHVLFGDGFDVYFGAVDASVVDDNVNVTQPRAVVS
jgi:hypothetical protein